MNRPGKLSLARTQWPRPFVAYRLISCIGGPYHVMADAWHFFVEAVTTPPLRCPCTRLIVDRMLVAACYLEGSPYFFLLVFTESKSGNSRAIYIFNDWIAFSQC